MQWFTLTAIKSGNALLNQHRTIYVAAWSVDIFSMCLVLVIPVLLHALFTVAVPIYTIQHGLCMCMCVCVRARVCVFLIPYSRKIWWEESLTNLCFISFNGSNVDEKQSIIDLNTRCLLTFEVLKVDELIESSNLSTFLSSKFPDIQYFRVGQYWNNPYVRNAM